MANIADLGFRVNASGLLDAGNQLTGISLSLTAIAASAISFGRDFDKSQRQTQATLNITGEEMAKLREQALQLGSTTAFSATQASDAMGVLAQTGLDAGKVFEIMPSLLSFATAGSLDLAKAAEITMGAINGFKLEVKDSAAVQDLFVMASVKSNSTIEELSRGFGVVAPVAKMFNMDMYATAATLGVLADNTIKGSEGGTALRNMLSILIEPAGGAKEALEKLNLTQKNFFDIAKDGTPTFKGIPNMIDELTKAGAKGGEMMAIFGAETASAASSLMGMSAKIRENEEVLRKRGAVEEAVAIKSKGLDFAIVSMASAWEGFNLQLMEKGGYDIATNAVEGITGALGWLASHAGDAIDVLMWLWDTFGEAGLVLGGASAAIYAVASAVGILSGAFSGLLALIAANPIGASIALLVTAGWLLYDNWSEVVAGAKALWSDLMDWFDGLMDKGAADWYQDAVNLSMGFTNGLMSMLGKVKEVGGLIGSAALKAYDEVTDTHSPSREMEKRGDYFGEGLANGITKSGKKVSGAAAKVATQAVSEFDRMTESLNLQYIKLTQSEEAASRYELSGKKITGAAQDTIIKQQQLIESTKKEIEVREASSKALEQAQYKYKLLTTELSGNKDQAARLTITNQYLKDGVLTVSKAVLEQIIAIDKESRALQENDKKQKELIESRKKATDEINKAKAANEQAANAVTIATRALELNDVELRALTLSYEAGYNKELAKTQAANEEQARILGVVRTGTKQLTQDVYLHNLAMTQGADAVAVANLVMSGYTEELARNEVATRSNMQFQTELYDAIYNSLSSASNIKEAFSNLGDWLTNWLKEQIAYFATNQIMAYMGVTQSASMTGNGGMMGAIQGGGVQGSLMAGGMGYMAGQALGQSGIGSGLGAAIGNIIMPGIGGAIGAALGAITEMWAKGLGVGQSDPTAVFTQGMREGQQYTDGGHNGKDHNRTSAFGMFGIQDQGTNKIGRSEGFVPALHAALDAMEEFDNALAAWLPANEVNRIKRGLINIDIKGFSTSEMIRGRLAATIGAMSDQLKGAFTGSLNLATASAEELQERIAFVTSATDTLSPIMQALGLSIGETFAQSVVASAGLADAFGSVETATERLTFYANNFIPSADLASTALSNANESLLTWNESIGLSGENVINTESAFRSYIETLDLTTASGQAAAAAALQQMESLLLVSESMALSTANFDALTLASQQLNLNFDATSPLANTAADALIQLMGGLDAFTASAKNYYELFYSETEQQQLALAQAAIAVRDYNTMMGISQGSTIDTRDEFRDMVESLDLTTESGRLAYQAAMNVASSMAIIADNGTTLDQVIGSLPDTLNGAFGLMQSSTATSANNIETASRQASAAIDSTATSINALASSVSNLGAIASSQAGTVATKTPTTIKAYADGGEYGGGLALVGEQGAELINFNNPGQVYNASQTRNILSSDSGSSDDIKALKEAVLKMAAQQAEQQKIAIAQRNALLSENAALKAAVNESNRNTERALRA